MSHRSRYSLVALFTSLTLVIQPLWARVINVPDDNQTIQSGIDAAEEGDTVLVQPGLYEENVSFAGRNIILASLFLTTGEYSYINSTVLDGRAAGSVVRLLNGETNATVVSGFTIRNGRANYGAGIYLNGASPTLDHLIIAGNHAVRDGGGVYCTHSATPIFNHLTMTADSADRGNGGLHAYDNSVATITNSIFWANIPVGMSAGQTVTYSDIQNGYAGQGNVNSNPQFVDPANGNYQLQDNSPCVDAGDQNAPNDPDNTRADMGALYNNQTPRPSIHVSQEMIDFGPVRVGEEVSSPIMIRNWGDADLFLFHPATDGDPFHADLDEWESDTLAQGDSLEVWAFFAPTERGEFAGHYLIISNDQENDTLDIPLSGVGALPSISLDADTLVFGEVLIDNRVELPLVISNAGLIDLLVRDVVVEGNYFSVEFDGQITLQSGESVAVMVAFLPAEAGEFEEIVTVASDDPDNPEMTVVLIGRGAERGIEEIGSIDSQGEALGIAMAGPLALVANGQDGLRIFDISDPSNPAELGNLDTPGNARSITVSNGYAYIADEEGGLRKIDFSDPSNPVEVWAFDTPGVAYGIAAAGSYVYVADFDGGLRIVDISNPDEPRDAGTGEIEGNARSIAVLGDFAYVTAGEGGLKVIDVADRENPREVGSIDTPGNALGIAVRGGYAYVADGEEGLAIIDVSSPANPEARANYNTEGSAISVVIAGGFAYVANGASGIAAINITEPERLEEDYRYDTPGEAQGVAVQGQLCFVSDGESGVRVLTVADFAQYPLMSVAPESLDFGVRVTDHGLGHTITIANQGNWDLHISQITVEGACFIGGLDDPVVIEPGNSIDIAVTFLPEEAGEFAGTAIIYSDDPYSDRKEIPLSGRGLEFNIIEERGSLREFFAGEEEGCAYDNWISHVVEGIAVADYNDYGPPELDRQTNGFGAFTAIDSLENKEEIIADWREIFDNLTSGNVDAARVALALSDFSDNYSMVHLEDGEKDYIILRERLNEDYVDDNGTQDQSDDVIGSFDLGWGLFIFDLDPVTPNVVIEVPHPEDDFLACHSGYDAFATIGARAFFVAGVGREVAWTGVGNYSNLKSLADPTRLENSAFHQAHLAVVDLIDEDFVIQVHSYDSDAHPNLKAIELSTRLDYYPNPPVLDFDNRFDMVSLTPEVPVAANSSGHENHAAVRVDDFYAVWYDTSYQGVYRYQNRLPIDGNVTMFASSWNEQMLYSFGQHDTLEDDENWLHVELDEFPGVINEDILDYYSAGGRVTYRNYAPAVDFYHPTYVAIRNYYHHNTLLTVPGDFQTIQDAIDGSASGDTVLVSPGTYVETINFMGKNITVASLFLTTGDEAYLDSTIIDGDRNGSVVRLDSGENNGALLTGFTIRNGSGSIDAENDVSGGGIHCHDASPRLSYLKVLDNNAWYAAGIYCELGSDAIIDHCLISGNTASIAGGGMDCYAASPTVTNCTITGNNAIRGGGLYLYDNCNLTISNSIFWNNEPQEILFAMTGAPDTLNIFYSDVMNGERDVNLNHNGVLIWGDGNLDRDPEFAAAENGNYALTDASPCLDAGNPDGGRDPDGTWMELGALHMPHERNDQPRILIDAVSYEFDAVELGQSVEAQIQLRNVGYAPLTVSEISLSGDNPDDFSVDFEQVVSVDPGQIETIRTSFTPSEVGQRFADLLVSSNDPVYSEIEAALTGFGVNRQDRHVWIVPDDLLNIQDAISMSVDGDTVLVRPGEYQENVVFTGKEIILASFYLTDNNPETIVNTIIHGDSSGGVVSFLDGEGATTKLVGFTITGGLDGIYCETSSPTIRNCIVTGNTAVNAGGAGLYARGGAAPQLINCTIIGNSARWGGGEYIREGSSTTLTNCIVWDNDPDAAYSSGAGAQNRMIVGYSDVQDGQQGIVTNGNCQLTWGNGNQNSDPRFIDPDNGNFRLSEGSPCIDAGNANSPLDPDSTRADQGALFFNSQLPQIAVSPDSLLFEPTRIGETSELALTIGNSGTADLTIQNVAVEGESFSVAFEGEIALEPDSSLIIAVTFSPAATGEFHGMLTINSSDPETPEVTVPLQGIGENDPPELTREIPDLSFDEDSGPWEIADLDTVFSDPNGDELSFEVTAPDPLRARVDGENHTLLLEAPDNFNADSLEIQITASDQQGGRQSISMRTVRNIRSLKEEKTGETRRINLQPLSPAPFRNVSRDGIAEDSFILTITPVNDAPRWQDVVGEIEVNRGEMIEFTLTGFDPDEDGLRLTIVDDDGTIERGASFVDHDDQTGTYSWQTDVNDVGVYEPVFEAADPFGFSSHTSVEIRVIDRNTPPEVASSLSDLEFNEDTGPWIIADLDSIFIDVDGDSLTFSVEAPQPLDITIDEETHVLSIESPVNFNGTELEILVSADDGHEDRRLINPLAATIWNPRSSQRELRSLAAGTLSSRDASATSSFMLTILSLNDAPEWLDYPVERLSAVEGDTIRFELYAVDVDTNRLVLTFASDNLPGQARLNDNGDGRGVFYWETDLESAGSYSATVSVSDDVDTVSFEMNIDVSNQNRPPELIRDIADVVVNEDCGQVGVQDLDDIFRDADNEALSYTIEGAPVEAGMRVEGSVLQLNPQAHYNHPTPVRITITATDSSLASVQCEFDLTIDAVNYPPAAFNLFAPADGHRVNRGEYNVEFVWGVSEDVDPEDSLRYNLYLHVVFLQIDSTVIVSNLTDSVLTMPLDSLLRDLGVVSDVFALAPIIWWVEATDDRATVRSTDRWQAIVETPLSLREDASISTEFSLLSVYPNPFNSQIQIEYSLPIAGHVQLSIYNLSGRQVASLSSGSYPAGIHSILWSADREAAGIYVIRLDTDEKSTTWRVLLVK